jgi:Copper type II ascorbate-dependent monooxygenase, C-terminal domain
MDSNQARYFLLVTHYHDMTFDYESDEPKQMADNSGLRLYLTPTLRQHDAGVLSVGVDPNWRHLIPPGQEKVVSEGHCVEDCTRRAFPPQGINIFAVMMRVHEIGRKVKLRQVRGREELLPIAEDSNIDINFLEYRRLKNAAKAMPGDRLIAECTYDSSSREAITLGK